MFPPRQYLPHLLTDEALQLYLSRAKDATEMLLVYTDVQLSSGEYELYLFREIADRQLGFADGEGWAEASYTFIVPGDKYAVWFWRRFFFGVTGLADSEEMYPGFSVDAAAEKMLALEKAGRLRLFSAPASLTMTPLLLMDGFSAEPVAILPFSESDTLRFVALPKAYAQRTASIWFDLFHTVGTPTCPLSAVTFESVSGDIIEEASRLKRVSSSNR